LTEEQAHIVLPVVSQPPPAALEAWTVAAAREESNSFSLPSDLEEPFSHANRRVNIP
jgi:hypothetical protein